MKIAAGTALVKVLESWNIKHIYGIPGSSVNGLMDSLYGERDAIKYIQVRHEGAGAMAAAVHAKYTGELGVCFGSAAPGGSNLMNGLYDAKMDRVPLLALVGQTSTENMNTTFFQEMDEIPLYADVSIYNHCATTAAQIPDLVEEAIRTAYSQQGVAVVILPNDLMETVIDYLPRAEKKAPPQEKSFPISQTDVDQVLTMIKRAERPVLYGGLGLRGARDVVAAVSEKFSLPIVTSVPAIGVAAANDHENFMGSFGRLGTKPAYDVLNQADLVLFIGSNFPFARYWPKDLKVIQINNEIADIGKQIPVELGIVADGKAFLEQLLQADFEKPVSKFLKAARISKENWDKWLDDLAADETKGLAPEAVIKAIKEHSTENAFYGLDVGNNTIQAIRGLPLNKERQHTVSGWFATLGVALPYSIDAKLNDPDRQVWSISGDGGFAMNMQEIITQSLYELPIINIVLDNHSYGFIEHAQILSDFNFGVHLPNTDWAMSAKGMGAITFTVTDLKELHEAMDEIEKLQASGNKKPILIDAKIYYADPMDTSQVALDPDKFTPEEIAAYKEAYNVFNQPSLTEILGDLD